MLDIKTYKIWDDLDDRLLLKKNDLSFFITYPRVVIMYIACGKELDFIYKIDTVMVLLYLSAMLKFPNLLAT